MSPHILCIMSHYKDPALSLRRLEITDVRAAIDILQEGQQ